MWIANNTNKQKKKTKKRKKKKQKPPKAPKTNNQLTLQTCGTSKVIMQTSCATPLWASNRRKQREAPTKITHER